MIQLERVLVMKINVDRTLYKEFFFPWKIILSYFVFCFFLYLIGPWQYRDSPSIQIFLYILLFCCISTMGFRKGIKASLLNANGNRQKKISKNLLNIVIVISFFSIICMILIKIKQEGIPSFGNIFALMAKAYSTTSSAEIHTDQALSIFYKTAPFFYLAIPVGLYEYRNLKITSRIMFIITIIMLVVYTVLYSGQQKQIGDIVILILSVVMIKYKPGAFGKLSKKQLLLLLMIVIIVSLFSSILSGRMVMMNKTIYNSSSIHYQLNEDSLIFKILPESTGLGLAYFIFYISHGFYGLNLCLQQPFVWTGGFGGANVIATLFNQYLGISFGTIETYPYRTELVTGWSSTSVWHTIFPWLASDLTWIGAILFLTLCAYIYGKCWYEIKYQGCWQSIFLFAVLTVMWFYMVANNQLLTAKSTFFVLLAAIVLWLFRNVKFRWRK